MTEFTTRLLAERHDAIAPDGSEVRVLAALDRASMAHFRLPPGGVSLAVRHRTVAELWYVLSGTGEMWRSFGDHQEVTALAPGVSLTIPVGTAFQFRAQPDAPLCIVAVTVPAWPGDAEAVRVQGPWLDDE